MIAAIIKTMRVPFLVLTPACIFLGFATAYPHLEHVPVVDVILILLCGLLAHISVNMFNEYQDFQSGLDAQTQRTPFSGGSGGLIEAPQVQKSVLFLAVLTLLLTMAIGIYFIQTVGWQLLLLGIVGVVIIVTYTQWINRSPLLCLIAPGISFGTLMVIGTHWVLAGSVSIQAVIASLIPLCLVSNLLLLNQLPDITADISVGRRHFPIQYGIKNSALLYLLLSLIAMATVIVASLFGYFPLISLLTLLPLLVTLKITKEVLSFATTEPPAIDQLIPYLGLNVAVTILSPVVLAISLLV